MCLLVMGACSNQPAVTPDLAPTSPTEVAGDRVFVNDDDMVVPGFEPDLTRTGSSSQRSRADATTDDPHIAATATPPGAGSSNGEGSATPSHKTSMPQRAGASAKSARLGGVRKAIPVDQAARDLFGLWTVDTDATHDEQFKADRVIFVADGRMRIWRGGACEDGRWNWTADEGVKTGGIDGVAFTLGEFVPEGETMVISTDPATRVVLRPDRFFVAPKSVRSQPTSH